ncbi:MAG: DUF2442 domain-containing protein [Clostridia bacterium]|nr:DUF2442 domain-containing protein [Clostridia bacterium]
MNPQALSVEPLENYQLRVGFDNGEVRIFDVKPLIRGSWMGELADKAYFKTVRIGGLSVEWPHEQDICPDQLYECSKPVTPESVC